MQNNFLGMLGTVVPQLHYEELLLFLLKRQNSSVYGSEDTKSPLAFKMTTIIGPAVFSFSSVFISRTLNMNVINNVQYFNCIFFL